MQMHPLSRHLCACSEERVKADSMCKSYTGKANTTYLEGVPKPVIVDFFGAQHKHSYAEYSNDFYQKA